MSSLLKLAQGVDYQCCWKTLQPAAAFQFPISISDRPALWRELYINITRSFRGSFPQTLCRPTEGSPLQHSYRGSCGQKLPQLLCLVPATFLTCDLFTLYSLKDCLQLQLQSHWLASSQLYRGTSSFFCPLFCWTCQLTAHLLWCSPQIQTYLGFTMTEGFWGQGHGPFSNCTSSPWIPRGMLLINITAQGNTRAARWKTQRMCFCPWYLSRIFSFFCVWLLNPGKEEALSYH